MPPKRKLRRVRRKKRKLIGNKYVKKRKSNENDSILEEKESQEQSEASDIDYEDVIPKESTLDSGYAYVKTREKA